MTNEMLLSVGAAVVAAFAILAGLTLLRHGVKFYGILWLLTGVPLVIEACSIVGEPLWWAARFFRNVMGIVIIGTHAGPIVQVTLDYRAKTAARKPH